MEVQTMQRARTERLQCLTMLLGAISCIMMKAILRVYSIIIIHQLISKDLGHN